MDIRRTANIWKTGWKAVLAGIGFPAVTLLFKLALSQAVGHNSPFLFLPVAILLTTWFAGFWPGMLATIISVVGANWFFMDPLVDLSDQTLTDLTLFTAQGMLLSFLVSIIHQTRGRLIEATQQRALAVEEMEEALRLREQRFRQLAEALPQLVWTARPDGTVDYYNERREEYEGIRPESDGSYLWGPVLHPDDLQPTVEAWMHALQTGSVYEIAHRVRLKNGSFHWVLSRGIPVRNDAGEIVKWYGTATDIDELKRAEQAIHDREVELRALNENLEERVRARTRDLSRLNRALEVRNRELQDFAHVASHDLQEPLRKVAAFADLLMEDYGNQLDENARYYLERMQNATGRMSNLIRDLLAFSRVTTRGNPFEEVNLNETVDGVLQDLEVRLKETGGRVVTSDLCTVHADPTQMRQLFQNLIGNALKFHRPHASPVVHVSMRVEDPAGDHEDDQMCVVEVKDNGIGFEPEHAERIFAPFQRLHGKHEYEGSGIGLAICQRIVERHHGTITATSEPGKGSCFTVRLPLNIDQSGGVESASA